MLPTEAVIRSSDAPASSWKLFGQSLLERNIRILRQAGIIKVFLDLSDEDLHFYENKIRKHIEPLNGIEIIFGKTKSKNYMLLYTNHFIMFNAFAEFEENFSINKGICRPVKKKNQFIIENDIEFNKARETAIEIIRTGSGGKIAQNINKRISIPLSLVFARFRVIPNIITITNFFLGVLSIVLISSNHQIDQAAGGILVQTCSILDGCDGEVARMTTRFSKLGGILDTISDQMLAVALIAVALYKVYINFSPLIFWINMIGVVGGVAVMMGIIIYFVRKYTLSMSLAAYNREFLDILPDSDRLVCSMRYLQYFPRKEIYSMMVCLFCLFGALHYYMAFFTLVGIIGAILVIILGFKYFPKLKPVERQK